MTQRRGRGDGSIHQRKDGRWCGILDLGIIGGIRKRKSVYGKTRREVVVKLGHLRSSSFDGVTTDDPTLDAWLHYWLDNHCGKLKPQSRISYRQRVDLYLTPLLGRYRLSKLQPAHVVAAYNRLRQPCPDEGRCPHKPSHGLAEGTIRQAHAVLRRSLEIAMRHSKVTRNVATLVDAPSGQSDERTPLTLVQARKVLKAAADTDQEARWYAALYLGMRQGEALGLAWANVDLTRSTLTVEQTLQEDEDGMIFGEPKSRRSKRLIPLPTVVASRLAVEQAQHVSSCTSPATCTHLVWPDPNDPDKPMRRNRDYRRWRDLLAAAGVPPVSLHAARNTAGSLLDAAGVSPSLVRDILGHTHQRITERYQHGDLVRHREAMAALEAHVSPTNGV